MFVHKETDILRLFKCDSHGNEELSVEVVNCYIPRLLSRTGNPLLLLSKGNS